MKGTYNSSEMKAISEGGIDPRVEEKKNVEVKESEIRIQRRKFIIRKEAVGIEW